MIEETAIEESAPQTDEAQEAQPTEFNSLLNAKEEPEEAGFKAGERPEDLDDSFWDDENKTFKGEELYKGYLAEKQKVKGLRDKLARGEQNPPEKAEDYKIEFNDEAKEIIGDNELNSDVISLAQKAAFESGMSQTQYNEFMSRVIPQLEKYNQANSSQPEMSPEQIAQQAAEFQQEQLRDLGQSARRVIDAVAEYVEPLNKSGVMTESMQALFNEFTSHADGLRILNVLRASSGGSPLEISQLKNGGSGFGWSKEDELELQRLILSDNPNDQSKKAQMFSKREKYGIQGPLMV